MTTEIPEPLVDLHHPPIASNELHRRVIRATAVTGSAGALNVLFRIIQLKAIALLLGPAGVGVMGIFMSLVSVAGVVSAMGLTTSGVRQLSMSLNGDDTNSRHHTLLVFRRLSLILAVTGSTVFLLLAQPISRISFGNDQYVVETALLAIVIFLSVISNFQTTVVRAARRIRDFARINLLGLGLGTLLALPLLLLGGTAAISAYLIASALFTTLVSWWYSRKISSSAHHVGWHEQVQEARQLLGLGVSFMVASVTTLGVTYLVKILVTQELGITSNGYYEAASLISRTYVGFILLAMAADFYPHIASISHDSIKCNQLINAQVEIGIIIATPGILILLTFGPWILQILYSSEFIAAFDQLRWQVVGTFLQTISWSLGYLILARGKGPLFFSTELAGNIVYLVAVWFGIRWMGLTGLGAAYMLLYLFQLGLMTLVLRREIRFAWSRRNIVLIMTLFPIVVVTLGISYLPMDTPRLALGTVLIFLTGIYAVRSLLGYLHLSLGSMLRLLPGLLFKRTPTVQ